MMPQLLPTIMKHDRPTAAFRVLAACALGLLSALATVAGEEPLPVAKAGSVKSVSFAGDILPIFRKKCLACHNKSDKEASLSLETPAAIRKGGDSGPAVVAGKPQESLLFLVARHAGEPVMPPEDNDVGADHLTPIELARLRRWIELGAKDDAKNEKPAMAWRAIPAGIHPVYALAMAPGGRYLAAARGNRVELYHVRARRSMGLLTDPAILETGLYSRAGVAHFDYVQSLAFHPSLPILATGGYRVIKIWRRPRPRLVLRSTGDGNPIVAVAAAGKTRLRYALASDGTVTCWKPGSPKPAASWRVENEVAPLLAVWPESGRVAIATRAGAIEIRTSEGKLVGRCLRQGAAGAICVVEGGRLAVGGADGHIELFEGPQAGEVPRKPVEWKRVGALQGGGQAVTALAVVPDSSRRLVAGGADGTIRIWDVAEKRTLGTLNQGAPIVALAVRGDGRRLVSTRKDGVSVLWDLERGKQLAELSGDLDRDTELARLDRQTQLAGLRVAAAKRDVESATKRLDAEEANSKKTREEAEQAKKALAKQEETTKKSRGAADKLSKQLAETEGALKKEEATAQSLAAAVRKLQAVLAEKKDKKKEKAGKETDDSKQPSAREIAEQIKVAHAKLKASQTKIAELKKSVARQTAALKKANEARDKAEAALKQAVVAAESAKRTADRAEKLVAAAVAELQAAKEAVVRLEQESRLARERLDKLRKQPLPAPAIAATTFSPDGTLLATGTADGRIQVWDGDSGLPLEKTVVPSAGQMRLAFVGDRALWAGSDSGELHAVTVLGDWELVRTIGRSEDPDQLRDRVTALAFSPDGRWLASGSGDPSRDGELKIWDVTSGRLVREIEDAHSDMVLDLAFSHDGRWLASSAADRFVKVFEAATGTHVRSLEGHTGHVLGIAWSADDRLLASAGADQAAKIWDARSGDQKRTIGGFKKEVTDIHFQGLTTNVLLVAADPAVQLRRSDNGAVARSFSVAADYVYTAGISADGSMLAVGGHRGVVWLWSQDGKLLSSFQAASGPP